MFSWLYRKKASQPSHAAFRRKLYIPEYLYRKMINHCLEEKPLEACGLLGGVGDHVTAGYATDNEHRSPVLYKVDDGQLLEAFREVQANKAEIVAIYHSHIDKPPVPSGTDVDQATWPEAYYVIVSLAQRRPRVQAWRIVDGQVTEHPVAVVRGASGRWRDLRVAVRASTHPKGETDIL